jgi:predicted dehydrogenase
MVGAGRMGMTHLKALKKIDNVDVCAVVDPMEESRNNAAEEFSLKAYSSMKELFKEISPDAVYITTPIGLHLENIIEACEAGCHVFCEKPLVSTREEAVKLEAIAKDYPNKILFTGLVWRFNSTVIAVKEAISSGVIGPVLQFRAVCGGPSSGKRPAWFEDRKVAIRGCMLDNGVHFIDILSWTMSDEFTEAAAFTDQTDEKIDLNSAILLKTKNKVIGTMQFTSEMLMGASVEYFGKDGSILFYPGKFEYIIRRIGKDDEVIKVESNDRFLDMTKAFVDCAQGKCNSVMPVFDALWATATVDAGYKSFENGGIEKVTI